MNLSQFILVPLIMVVAIGSIVVTGAALTELEVNVVNLPQFILVPLIIVIAIGSIVAIRWLHNKLSGKK